MFNGFHVFLHQGTRRGTLEKVQKRLRITELKFTMDDHKINGSNHIVVLDFITPMVEQCDNLSKNEAKVFLVLPKFLTGAAVGNRRVARKSSRFSTGNITCWSEDLQYFL